MRKTRRRDVTTRPSTPSFRSTSAVGAPAPRSRRGLKVLVVDIGGNSIKALVSGETEPRKFPSGPTMRPHQMVSGVLKMTEDWKYDVVSIGYPGRVRDNQPAAEPVNLGHGWVRFDYAGAFGVPVRIMNDAAMQALGSYKGGTMLFLGLGTGLGTALVVDGSIVPMELGHLPYKAGTYEQYFGLEGLKRVGIRRWRQGFHEAVTRFVDALELDDVVIGGGNVTKLDRMPPGCRAGDNALAFRGGFLLWERDGQKRLPARKNASARAFTAQRRSHAGR